LKKESECEWEYLPARQIFSGQIFRRVIHNDSTQLINISRIKQNFHTITLDFKNCLELGVDSYISKSRCPSVSQTIKIHILSSSMLDSTTRDLPVHSQIPDEGSLRDLEVGRNSSSAVEECTETSPSTKNSKSQDISRQTPTTFPTRTKMEKANTANSYFEEKKERPCTRRRKSLMDRNSAANPGSSHHDV